MSSQTRLLPLLFALSAVSLSAQAAPTYTVAPVNGIGITGASMLSLNNAGTIAGTAYTPQGHANAYVSSNGTATSLYPGAANSGYTIAAGINDAGTVVGEVGTQNGPTRAAVFGSNGVQTLGTLGGTNSYGNGINASGQVVGRADTGNGNQRGFVTGANGSLIEIGPLNGGYGSDANAINDNGAVTGYVDVNGNGDYRAYIYTNGTMQILDTLGGNYAQGYAINNAGMVAGYAFLAGDMVARAFLYANGEVKDIGGFGGFDTHATGINEAGDVVGAGIDANNVWHAFLYSEGTFRDLNDLIDPSLGWNIVYAGDINDKGQIAARGCKVGNQCADLLLTLADTGGDPDPNPVPEPEAFTSGIAGLTLFGLLRRRRRQG